MHPPHLVAAVLLCVLALARLGSAEGEACEGHADCPGHVSGRFCSNEICLGGTCAVFDQACTGFCSEDLRRCVGCRTRDDCESGECDAAQGICRHCANGGASACPASDWCAGGDWTCNLATGKCDPPAAQPCAPGEACNADTRACGEQAYAGGPCTDDYDCGNAFEPRFCPFEGEVRCNLQTSRCELTRPPCALGERCDADRERCVACLADSDCEDPLAPFCSAPKRCDAESGTCVLRSPHAVDPCADDNVFVYECNEAAHRCEHVPCIADADCDDGNECNGAERCANHICFRAHPQERHCPDDGRTGTPCGPGRGLCAPGLICEISDPRDASVRTCTHCRNGAQCSDGDPANGDEVCNPTTHLCESCPDCAADDFRLGQQQVDEVASTPTNTTTPSPSPEEDRTFIALVIVVGVSLAVVFALLVYYAFFRNHRSSRRSRHRRSRY